MKASQRSQQGGYDPPGSGWERVRVRLAVAAISFSALALELALMRLLSARFWQHVAFLVISVALLGFGASGTVLTLFRRRIAADRRAWMTRFALGFALMTAVSARLAVRLPLDVHFLAWDARQVFGLLLLESVLLIPFLSAGAFVGTALMDRPSRVGGHYAVNLLGSGAGALGAVALLHGRTPEQLVTLLSGVGFLAALVLVPWRRKAMTAALVAVGMALVVLSLAFPIRPGYSAYKRIVFETAAGGEILFEAPGPLGRLSVVAGPSVHEHPGLGWEYTGSIPPHVLLLLDGDTASAVYRTETLEDWSFMDHTTAAVAYALADEPAVCLVGVGGGAGIGLARYHGATRITALEQNPQILAALRGPLRERGGSIVEAPGVKVVPREARSFFPGRGERYDLILIPPMDAFGASGGGLFAAQESFLYTVESFSSTLDRLWPEGLLAVTVWMQDPPRAGLRLFETLAEAFRRRSMDPKTRLAMIRSRTTITVLAKPSGFSEQDGQAIRRFCEARGFDLGYVPGMLLDEANRFHQLDRPYAYEGAKALLGSERRAFLREYLFSIDAPTDDRPFFFHAFRWRTFREFQRQLGGRTRAFLEPGYLMLLAAFGQAAVLAFLFVLLPLSARFRRTEDRRLSVFSLTYFLALGLGFLMLEMALLGRLILYVSDPIYAAAVAVSGFLIFAGLGSRNGERWAGHDSRVIVRAATGTALLGIVYAFGLGRWLGVTQGASLWVRVLVAMATVAPLAFAMGHLFPAGLRKLGRGAPDLVPWAWAINGFASVLAAVGTPLLALHIGYLRVGLLAAGFYLLAAGLSRLLPDKKGDHLGP